MLQCIEWRTKFLYQRNIKMSCLKGGGGDVRIGSLAYLNCARYHVGKLDFSRDECETMQGGKVSYRT